MHTTFLTDCTFVPGSKQKSVIDIASAEIHRDKNGNRNHVPYNQIKPSIFDPQYFIDSGFETVPISDGECPSDLAITAAEKILSRNQISPKDVGGLIYYDTLPYADEYNINIPCKVAQKTGMTNLEFQTHLTQKNCTSGLSALELATHILNSRKDMKWIVAAGGDCIVEKSGEPRIIHNEPYGDAGSAILVGRYGAAIKYLRCHPYPIGWKRHYEDIQTLQHISINYFKWSMQEINLALEKSECSMRDIAAILTNQPRICEFTKSMPGFSPEKTTLFRKHMKKYGHTLSHEIIEQMEQALNEHQETPVLAHATGIGTTMATIIFIPHSTIKLKKGVSNDRHADQQPARFMYPECPAAIGVAGRY